MTCNEPPLHQAVIDNDYRAIRELSRNPKQRSRKNALGFSALEIAQYLGKYDCVEILKPQVHRTIKVISKDSSEIISFSENDFEKYFQIKYRDHYIFQDYDSFQQTLKNCPWILNKSSFGEDNRLRAEHFRKELFDGYVANTSIRWIDEHLKFGLFAEQDLVPGDFIGEFTGKVRRLFRRHADQNEYCFHYPTRFWSWNYTVIDALQEGNETRFINHSDTPNLKPLCLCERSLLHIVFVAKTEVKAGTQLTYDYGKDFWRHRQKIVIH